MVKINHLTINTNNNVTYLPTQRKTEMNSETYEYIKKIILSAMKGNNVEIMPNIWYSLNYDDTTSTYWSYFRTKNGVPLLESYGSIHSETCKEFISLLDDIHKCYFPNVALEEHPLFDTPMIIDCVLPFYSLTPKFWGISGMFTKYLGWMLLDKSYKE